MKSLKIKKNQQHGNKAFHEERRVNSVRRQVNSPEIRMIKKKKIKGKRFHDKTLHSNADL